MAAYAGYKFRKRAIKRRNRDEIVLQMSETTAENMLIGDAHSLYRRRQLTRDARLSQTTPAGPLDVNGAKTAKHSRIRAFIRGVVPGGKRSETNRLERALARDRIEKQRVQRLLREDYERLPHERAPYRYPVDDGGSDIAREPLSKYHSWVFRSNRKRYGDPYAEFDYHPGSLVAVPPKSANAEGLRIFDL